jgi:hypothetical protein
MILFSTMRKFQAQDAQIYRVRIPAYTMKRGALCNTEPFVSPDKDTQIPESVQYFATQAQAAKEAARRTSFAQPGQPPVEVTNVPARSVNALTMEPV